MKKAIILVAVAFAFVFNAKAESVSVQSESYFSQTKVNPFCASIAKGDIETVKKLISLGEDVNQKSYGMTPLMYAAKFNRVDILKLLIENGANLKTKSDKGYNALRYAELSNANEAYDVLKEHLSKKKRSRNS